MLKQRRYGKPRYGTYQGGHYAGPKRWPRVLLIVLGILLGLAMLLFGALEIVVAVHDGTNITGQPDLMVIFGCQMRQDGPSIVLQDRLDTALSYWEEHPDIKLIVTGGQGDNEPVSEAQGMYDYLTAHGVDGENIYMEDQSRNTWQNVVNTFTLMEQEGLDAIDDVLLVSNGCHLARIKMLWNRCWDQAEQRYSLDNDQQISTLDAPVSYFPSAVHMFFREPLALVKSFLFDRQW